MPMTKKHLQAVAEELADICVALGADEEQTADLSMRFVRRLKQEGAITPDFDGERFSNAVREAYHGGERE